MGQIMKLRLSCYVVLLSTEAKPGNKTAAVPLPDPYDIIEKMDLQIYSFLSYISGLSFVSRDKMNNILQIKFSNRFS